MILDRIVFFSMEKKTLDYKLTFHLLSLIKYWTLGLNGSFHVSAVLSLSKPMNLI